VTRRSSTSAANLRLDRRVALVTAARLEQRLHVGHATLEIVDEARRRRAPPRNSPFTLRGAIGIVPELGAPETSASSAVRRRAGLVDAEIAVRLLDATPREISQVLPRNRAFQRPWHSLYFLPLPQKHGFVATGSLLDPDRFPGRLRARWRRSPRGRRPPLRP